MFYENLIKVFIKNPFFNIKTTPKSPFVKAFLISFHNTFTKVLFIKKRKTHREANFLMRFSV